MPLRFIPFDQRAPDYRRFKDDRLAQRDIGLTAMFMVRQAVMDQIRAYDPTNDMTALAAMDDAQFFSSAIKDWSHCFVDPVLGNG